MEIEDALRIAAALKLDESNRHPELHYVVSPQELLAAFRQIEAETLKRAVIACKNARSVPGPQNWPAMQRENCVSAIEALLPVEQGKEEG